MVNETKDDGGSAFPRAGYDGPDSSMDAVEGMRLRDYFAAAALPALLNGLRTDAMADERYGVALKAYLIAEDMLSVRTLSAEELDEREMEGHGH